MIRPKIAWPVLLIELDTTGVDRHDQVIRVECALVDQRPDGTLNVVSRYSGFEQPSLPISPAAYAVHGLTEEKLRGRTIHHVRLEALVSRAASIISRHPSFTAKKLHALVPGCLAKRWYEYPARIQGFPGDPFPADARMAVLLGEVKSFGYGRRHLLTELLTIPLDSYTLVFDEDGPPQVNVKLGRRKVLEGFPDAMLKCAVGTRFRLHGAEDYDFITGYCNDGPAYRERAFRLATTPSNLALVEARQTVYLERVDGLTYHLALK